MEHFVEDQCEKLIGSMPERCALHKIMNYEQNITDSHFMRM